MKSIAEAAERYASSILLDSEILLASCLSMELDSIDMRPLEECAIAESGNGFTKPIDWESPIRWVKGWCLLENKEKYVPAVMTHLFPRPNANENFWLPISTGTAAHTSLLEASVSAICELVERDAIALNWLTKRMLPRLREDSVNSTYLDEAGRSDTEFYFFDATTDIGVPTVYAIEEHLSDDKVCNVVACCTDFDIKNCFNGAVRELCSTRAAVKHSHTPIPLKVEDCVELEHGAKYLGQKQYSSSFDFLKKQNEYADASAYEGLENLNVQEQLSHLVESIRNVSNDLVLVDLTTDDLRECGLHAVRAVAPGLVPMSTHYHYRYLGHPRIRKYIVDVLDEDPAQFTLNPLPQPFA